MSNKRTYLKKLLNKRETLRYAIKLTFFFVQNITTFEQSDEEQIR